MKLTERIIENFIGRMSQEEKEALLEKVMEKFFDEMTPEEKQQLVEKMAQKLLEGVEITELLPRIMATMWKGAETDEEEPGILDKMTKLASETGEKLSEIIP